MSAKETHTQLERAEWLALARQQSERLEETRLVAEPAFDWSRVEPRRRWRLMAVPRLAIAAVVLLFAGSATWAFVARQSGGEERVAAPAVDLEVFRDEARRVGPAPLRRAALPVVTAPRERVVASPAPRRPRLALRRKAPVAAPAVTVAPKAVPEARTSSGPMRFGDEVIIVAPRAKMKPLFSTEEYKKRR